MLLNVHLLTETSTVISNTKTENSHQVEMRMFNDLIAKMNQETIPRYHITMILWLMNAHVQDFHSFAGYPYHIHGCNDHY